VKPIDARDALRSLAGFDVPDLDGIREIPGGWSSHTFAVEPDWIFRFPRSEITARGHAKERRLLPVVARFVTFEVPRFEHLGVYEGLEFAGHRRVRGRPLDGARADPAALAAMLDELHAVPVAEVRAVLSEADSRAMSWGAYYEELEREVARRVLPLLEPAVASEVQRGLRAYLETGLPEPAELCLVHADLGAVHILVDPATGAPRGMIDFEDASLGDPAIDVVGIRIAAGAAVAREVCAAHPRMTNAALERLDFFTWMGSVHAILYGLTEDRPGEVEQGIAGVTKRIAWRSARDPQEDA
jgi:aminoglycoside 2''-phosphotransferase